MNIGIDLDSTLLKLNFLEELFEKYNMKYYPALNWKMTNYPDIIRKEIFEIFKSDKMIHKNTFPYAKGLIDKFKNEGHNVIVVTARDKKIEQKTIDLVYDLFQVECVVTGMNESKLPYLQDFNIKLWIDDCPNELIKFINNDIKCIMISNNNTLYNHYLRNSVEWVESVEDIYKNYDFSGLGNV